MSPQQPNLHEVADLFEKKALSSALRAEALCERIRGLFPKDRPDKDPVNPGLNILASFERSANHIIRLEMALCELETSIGHPPSETAADKFNAHKGLPSHLASGSIGPIGPGPSRY